MLWNRIGLAWNSISSVSGPQQGIQGLVGFSKVGKTTERHFMGREANIWFSHVLNIVYTSCRNNIGRLEETTAWFGKLPGVGNSEEERLVLAPRPDL